MRALFLLAVAALLPTATLTASQQDSADRPPSDKATVEEFDLPRSAPDLSIQQVGPVGAGRSVLPDPVTSARALDEAVTIGGLPAAPRQPMAQLSRVGEREHATQLTRREESRQVAVRSVSDRSDSKPAAASVLGGTDRCAPGTATGRSARCQTVIERRADEFSAAQAPRLSAEQILLARSQDRSDAAVSAGRVRSPLATGSGPDANSPANQEIASIYLDHPNGAAPPGPASSDPGDQAAAAVAAILQGLQLGALPQTGQR